MPPPSSDRSAPAQKAFLPEVMTAPLMASSEPIFSTICPISCMTELDRTFIETFGESKVMSAMPSPSTSNLKCV